MQKNLTLNPETKQKQLSIISLNEELSILEKQNKIDERTIRSYYQKSKRKDYLQSKQKLLLREMRNMNNENTKDNEECV